MSTPKRGAVQAEALRRRLGLSYDQLVGLRFAVNVFIASTIVWFTLRRIGDSHPVWAIASMVAASDPQPDEARKMFRSRMINVGVGCATGSLFLLLGGRNSWMVPLTLAATVLVATWLVRVKTMWRQAPITAAVVVAAGLSDVHHGLQEGFHKIGEVIFGCLVGLLVSWFMAGRWLIQTPDAQDRVT